MQHKLKKLSITLIAAALFSTTSNSQDLSDVFTSYSSNSGGVFNTSQGNYWHGGSFQGRIPQQNVDFVRFTPPSVSGSCSGIDIFAGSFGLVSGDEIVQVARGIAQGAAPYFFNLAMQSICPSCQGVMNELSGLVNDLNQHGQNACEQVWGNVDESLGVGQRIARWAGTSGAENDERSGALESRISQYRDAVQGFNLFDTLTPATQQRLSTNIIVETVINNKDRIAIPSLNLSSREEVAEFVASLTGTIIFSTQNGCVPVPNQESCFGTTALPATLSLEDLYYAERQGDPATLLECTNTDCLSMRETNFESRSLQELFRREIVGEDNYRGILDRYNTKEDLDPTNQIPILRATRFPFHLVAAEFEADATDQLGLQLSDRIARNLVVELGRQILNILRESLITIEDDERLGLHRELIITRINAFEEKLRTFREQTREELIAEMEVTESINALTSLNRGRGPA